MSFGIGRYNVRINFYTYELVRLFYIKRKYYIFPRKKITKNVKIQPQPRMNDIAIIYKTILNNFIQLLFYKKLIRRLNLTINTFIKLKCYIDVFYIENVKRLSHDFK